MNRHLFRFVRSSLMTWLLAWVALCLVASTTHAAPGLTTLVRFQGPYQGNPVSDLILASDGNFYGTMAPEGTSGQGGSIFKLTPAGALTTLYTFTDGADGGYPDSLVEGSDGDFYGTTSGDGANGYGTVFKITPAGTLTTLGNFGGANGLYPNGLVEGSDGDFYGTTEDGGHNGDGTVFKITPTGMLTTLHNFSYTEGSEPEAALIQGADGDFYGTTPYGGSAADGTVFKVTPSGTLTTLHSFTGGADGTDPVAGLVQGTDGDFYGTTAYGGSKNFGTVFKITPSGTPTILVNFNSVNGATPRAGLILGSDGNFYGTTAYGDDTAEDYYGDGTLFKVTPAGTLTTLYTFMSNADGYYPAAALTEYSDGVFYGTTNFGADGQGTIFKYTLDDLVPTVTSFSPDKGPYASTVTLTGTNLNDVTAVRFHEADARSFTSNADGTQLTVTVPYQAISGPITVTSPGGSAVTRASFRITYAPVITSFSPTSGPVGTVVTITGTHLTGITRVRFHNADATMYSSNAAGTQLTVTVPPGAASGTITLDNRDTLATTSNGVFTVTP